jgi:hypothetical protein
MKRKLFISTIFLMLFAGMFQQLVFAQEEVELSPPQVVIRDSEGIKLKLVKQVQNPSTKEVVFDLVIYSLIDSDRVQVTWTVSGASEVISEPISVLSMKKNTVYERQLVIRPRELGVSTITARVEAFEAEGTFVSTATSTIGSFEDGMIFPTTSEYQLANVLITIRFVAVIILVFYILGLVVVVGYLRYKALIAKDERQF